MATEPIIGIPDQSMIWFDPKTGRLTQDGFRIISQIIKKLNQL